MSSADPIAVSTLHAWLVPTEQFPLVLPPADPLVAAMRYSPIVCPCNMDPRFSVYISVKLVGTTDFPCLRTRPRFFQ